MIYFYPTCHWSRMIPWTEKVAPDSVKPSNHLDITIGARLKKPRLYTPLAEIISMSWTQRYMYWHRVI